MRYNRMLGGLIALSMLFLTGTPAIACGGGLFYAFMFQKYPEAEVVSAATTKARGQGVLRGEQWDATTGKSRHAWRVEKLESTIRVLQDRLNPLVQPAADWTGMHIFLVNEFAWLKIGVDRGRAIVSRKQLGPGKVGVKLFTSRRVLDNLLDGTITWQQAVDAGLMVTICESACAVRIYGLLGLAMAPPQKNAQAGVE